MATTSPPSPPVPQPPGGPSRSEPAHPRSPRRWPVVVALLLVVLIVAYLLFGRGGGATYHLVFAEAGQLVKGDQVQVGGVPVGSVTNIKLRKDYRAEVTINVESSLAPLHAGTEAQVRVPSLSSVANRFIDLSPGPNSRRALPEGATLPASATKEVTDLDQLFNTLNPRTRQGLSEFIQGSAQQYVGTGKVFGESIELFPPFLSSTSHIFEQLAGDQPVFTHFLVETAKAVTTIGARSEQLADLVENANTTFGAIGSQQEQLRQGLELLPVTLKNGNVVFEELPATFQTLTRLVEASKPTSVPLTEFFTKLRGLFITGSPALHNFNLAVSRPGANNDLTDLARGLPALTKVLTSASPSSVTALKESVPITAFFGPYSPDLAGTLRTFGQSGAYYDANGHYARLTPVLPDFKLGENNTLKPASYSEVIAALKTGQLRRCPGGATQPAADKSSPFASPMLTCDPLQTP